MANERLIELAGEATDIYESAATELANRIDELAATEARADLIEAQEGVKAHDTSDTATGISSLKRKLLLMNEEYQELLVTKKSQQGCVRRAEIAAEVAKARMWTAVYRCKD